MKSRTKARGIALQVLYEYDLKEHPLGDSLEARFSEENLDDKVLSFSREIVLGITPIIKELDQVIDRILSVEHINRKDIKYFNS